MHTIYREIAFLYAVESIAAIDSFMMYICRYSTAARRKVWGNYTDPESGWSSTTKGRSYGRKCHVVADADSLIEVDWIVTKGNLHDSRVSHNLIDSVRGFSYILGDSACDIIHK